MPYGGGVGIKRRFPFPVRFVIKNIDKFRKDDYSDRRLGFDFHSGLTRKVGVPSENQPRPFFKEGQMKVLMVNGSPHEKGCTNAALSVIADTLREEGVESEIFWIGNKPLTGCVACLHCAETGKCVYDDSVNRFREKAAEADAFVFGSPVHYAAAAGSMASFMDRAFYSGSAGNGGKAFRHKPAACIVSARRAGTTAALEQLFKYPMIQQMPVISSGYWNMVHGSKPEDIFKDEEGIWILKTLARNMAYFLKCLDAGKAAGICPPPVTAKPKTDFVR